MPIQKQVAMAELSNPERNFLAPLFEGVDFSRVRTPVAERITRELFYIPLHHCMSDEDVEAVVRAVRASVG